MDPEKVYDSVPDFSQNSAVDATSDGCGPQDYGIRLGLCDVCSQIHAKYTCPRCNIHSCSVDCIKIHKEETGCSGQRNKTAYKPLKDFGDMDLLSDYRLLEEVGRSVDTCKRDSTRKVTRISQDLPVHLHKLRAACFRRNTRVRFMPSVMKKHKENTTRLDWKTNKIDWKVCWRVPQLDTEFIDDKFPEDDPLGPAIEEHLKGLKEAEETSQALAEQVTFLMSAGRSALRVFMSAEMQYKYSGKFYLLDLGSSLRQNLTGKVLVEHPTFIVVSKDHTSLYPTVDE